MSRFEYHNIISELNQTDVWMPKRIKLELTTDQFIAILKGYNPSMDMKFGLFYNLRDQYFYTYRSGSVLGKYKIDKHTDNLYSVSEMFANPQHSDNMVIFECVREACRVNHVHIDLDKLSEMAIETRRINGE